MEVERIVDIVFFGGWAISGFIKLLIILIKQERFIKIQGIIISSAKEPLPSGWYRGVHHKYQYEFEGKMYYIEDSFYGGNRKLNKGDEVDIYINPNDPNKILKPEDLYNKKLYFAIMIFCILKLIIF